ncbi:TPA: hypothetical protein ACS7Z7_003666 [Providencia alcalifaciens]|uniref:hypothetical protein n=1 Tax=Providencia sp. JUb39 TaxID=2724165 RepID=UPI00164E4F43|nr:hypothetical protein [Providencia sp. JUb39]MBC5792345.1 hypothetical protein [Providencia sp. JUb39]
MVKQKKVIILLFVVDSAYSAEYPVREEDKEYRYPVTLNWSLDRGRSVSIDRFAVFLNENTKEISSCKLIVEQAIYVWGPSGSDYRPTSTLETKYSTSFLVNNNKWTNVASLHARGYVKCSKAPLENPMLGMRYNGEYTGLVYTDSYKRADEWSLPRFAYIDVNQFNDIKLKGRECIEGPIFNNSLYSVKASVTHPPSNNNGIIRTSIVGGALDGKRLLDNTKIRICGISAGKANETIGIKLLLP